MYLANKQQQKNKKKNEMGARLTSSRSLIKKIKINLFIV